MPPDNLEKFLQTKVAELDNTPPPGVKWNKAQGWRQLHPEITINRRPATIWYQKAAAVAMIIASALFNSNLKNENVPVNSTKITIIEPIPIPLPDPQPLIHQVKSTDFKTLGIIAAKKPQVLKNLKKRVKDNFAVANKPVNIPAKEPGPELSQNIIYTGADTPAAPLAVNPTPAPVGQTPVKITVVLGGKTNRQMATYAAANATKADRKKRNRLKVQVNIPPPERPEDAAITAKAHPLSNRSVLSAQINL